MPLSKCDPAIDLDKFSQAFKIIVYFFTIKKCLLWNNHNLFMGILPKPDQASTPKKTYRFYRFLPLNYSLHIGIKCNGYITKISFCSLV